MADAQEPVLDQQDDHTTEEGQAYSSKSPETQRLESGELERILEVHKKWLNSDDYRKWIELGRPEKSPYEQGKADLSFCNLQQADLQCKNLKEANLRGTNLKGALLRNADLEEADLTNATGLLACQLAGANLSGAKLPKGIGKFEEGLKFVEESTRAAKKIFLALLAGCAYSVLTIYSTTDAELLTNNTYTKLPIIGTGVPIAGFFGVAPALLLGTFIYLHLYLENVWTGLADLPAVFPNGRPLDREAYPWLVNSLVRWHRYHLRDKQAFVVHLRNFILTILVWWVPPLTIAMFWLRSLTRHDWWLTGFQIGFLVLAFVGGAWLLKRTGLILRGMLPAPISLKEGQWKSKEFHGNAFKRSWKLAIATGLLALISWVISDGAIEGVSDKKHRYFYKKKGFPANIELNIPDQIEDKKANGKSVDSTPIHRVIVPKLLPWVGARAFANLANANVSTRPENWFVARGTSAEGKALELLDVINGAQLRHADLRNVNAVGAFLGKAELHDARLDNAELMGAQLQEADLSGAQLQGANLSGAEMQKAVLLGANLQKADLWGAQLQEADLIGVQLQLANLSQAQLQEANLTRAQLQNAFLFWAELQGTKLSQAQLQKAVLLGANLQKADLSGAQLQGAILSDADLRAADLTDVKGLTQSQIDRACADLTTKLPPDLQRPSSCKPPTPRRSVGKARLGQSLALDSASPVLGNRRSHIYHRPDCPNYSQVAPKNQVEFNSAAGGYRVARNCP